MTTGPLEEENWGGVSRCSKDPHNQISIKWHKMTHGYVSLKPTQGQNNNAYVNKAILL